MKIKNTLCLHILMALLAILVLSVHPVVTSFDPPLKFQPMIKSMEGTPKEQAEKIATISHALQGNAIFFIGASEVSTSENGHYAVYNYFNKQLHVRDKFGVRAMTKIYRDWETDRKSVV